MRVYPFTAGALYQVYSAAGQITNIALHPGKLAVQQEPVDVSKVDVSMNGIELQDHEFVAAIRECRVPNASVAQ